jgi:uncharacterized membrane protein YeiH
MGAITGCAGGLIRDVLVAEVPLVFRQTELYVTACAAGIAVYLGSAALGLATGASSMLGMAVIALVRLASIRWGITLPILQLPADGNRGRDGD